MELFGRIKSIISANINDLIAASDDPTTEARKLIRNIEGDIIALRGKVRVESDRVARAARELKRVQEETALWEERANRAADENKEDLACSARQRRDELNVRVKELEMNWWEACKQKEVLDDYLRQLENQVQVARRRKESIIAKSRQDKSSSDFIPIRKMEDTDEGMTSEDMSTVEEELRKLKENRE